MGTMVLAQKIIKFYQMRWDDRFNEMLKDEFKGDITSYLNHIELMIAHDKLSLINQLESDLEYTDRNTEAEAYYELLDILNLLRGI